MGTAIVNANCPLSGTKYCRMLNMHACADCTVRDYERFDELTHDLDTYEKLLPEEGLSGIFEDPLCKFCRIEPKKAAAAYAVLYMAHPEPKHVQKHLFGKRAEVYGTVVPVQLPICHSCRRKLLAIEYLPSVLPLLAGILGLAVLCLPNGGQNAIGVGVPVPLIAWLCAVIVASIGGRLIANAEKKALSEQMATNVYELPQVKELLALGWVPVAGRAKAKLLFSDKRLDRGLGTAPGEKVDMEAGKE